MTEASSAVVMESVDREIDAWVEATRKLTGKVVEERKPWIENVNEENIRHFAQGTDDQNPLWLDPTVAAKTKWGGIIAPPAMIFANRYPILHGAPMAAPLASLIGGVEAEFHQPVRPGDRLSSTPIQKEFYEKRNKEGRRLNFVISEVTYRNQNNDVVAIARGTMIMATQVGLQKMMEHAAPRYTDADLERLESAWRNEYRRGATTLYIGDVEVGSSIPEIVRGPFTIGDLVAWNAAIGPDEVHAHGHVQSDHQFPREVFAAARGLSHGSRPGDARTLRQRRDAVCLDGAAYHQLDGIRWLVAQPQRPGASPRPLRRSHDVFGGNYRKGRDDRRGKAQDFGASTGRIGNDGWRGRGCFAKEVTSSLFRLEAAIAGAIAPANPRAIARTTLRSSGLHAARRAKLRQN